MFHFLQHERRGGFGAAIAAKNFLFGGVTGKAGFGLETRMADMTGFGEPDIGRERRTLGVEPDIPNGRAGCLCGISDLSGGITSSRTDDVSEHELPIYCRGPTPNAEKPVEGYGLAIGRYLIRYHVSILAHRSVAPDGSSPCGKGVKLIARVDLLDIGPAVEVAHDREKIDCHIAQHIAGFRVAPPVGERRKVGLWRRSGPDCARRDAQT